MPKAIEVDDDVMRPARGIKAMRERHGLTQRQAAEAHARDISYQYWAMNESGKVPGIVKPATQRELLDAISKAAGLENPLTLEDLAKAMDDHAPPASDQRSQRLASSLVGARPERQAVFPTSDGDVVFSFPADMTAEGFRELEAYFSVFVKANTPRN
jgi:hypothetical protein